MNFKKNRGFTLIELLVVIAIIGILSSVVLTSLNSARDKGHDASAKASISNARASAEVIYDGASASYATVCAAGNDVETLTDAAEAETLNTVVCNANATSYAISIPLRETGRFFCVDSTGNAAESGTALAALFACP